MTYSDFSLGKRRRTYVRLIGDIRDQLHQALEEEQTARQMTQQKMASVLNTSKSFVSRKLNGTSNMTLETLADLAYALDRVVEVRLRARQPHPGSNVPQLDDDSPYAKLLENKPKSSGTANKAKLKRPELISL